MKRFALLVIGDEILNGRVTDSNSTYLAKSLHRVGATLIAISTVGDLKTSISREINRLQRDPTLNVDTLITSGGIGPTHDDITMEAVGMALAKPLVYSDDIIQVLEARFKPGTTSSATMQAAKRMALIPEGATLFGERGIPSAKIDNVIVLPGVPTLFEQRIDELVYSITPTEAFFERIELNCYESEIAEALAETARQFPGCKIGSYPKKTENSHHIELTFDATEKAIVAAATADFKARIDTGT